MDKEGPSKSSPEQYLGGGKRKKKKKIGEKPKHDTVVETVPAEHCVGIREYA